MGFLNMKSSIKLAGLINVSGFHIDPGYDGKLVFSVFNAGPRPVTIRQGDNCFLMWLATIEDGGGPSLEAGDRVYHKDTAGFSGIDSKLINSISGDVISIAALSEIVKKVQSENSVIRSLLLVLLTLAVAIFILFLSQSYDVFNR